MRRLDRRGFVAAGLAWALVPAPGASRTVRAQPAPRVYRVGFVGFVSGGRSFEVFREALADLGYVEGRNLVIETRFADGDAARLPGIMADLARLKVEVIVAASTLTVKAAMQATTVTPIVFASVFDPVGSGLVSNLARPGGNVTGAAISVGGSGLGGKWLEVLREAVPAIATVAVLVNPRNPASMASLQEAEEAAGRLGVRAQAFRVAEGDALEHVLAAIGASGAQGLIVTNDPLFTPSAERLVAFAAQARLPAIYYFRSFADAGGLMVYGASTDESHRRAAGYVGRVLRGANPGSLPIEQPTRLVLTVNLRTAEAMGLVLPASILARADEILH